MKILPFLFLLFTISVFSQQAVPASGGTVSGVSGSFSVSVGQAVNGYFENATHSVSQGVQQTYVTYITQVQPAQCGTVLATLETAIVADAIVGAQKYRFEVSNGGNVSTVEVVNNSFALSQLSGGACFKTAYEIRVALQYGSVWYDYGTSCTITTPDVAPTAAAQTFCSSATVANLTATGTAIKWYNAASGGTALATNTNVISGTYYASQTINGCESSRTSVLVMVNPKTTPTFTEVSPICGGAALKALSTTSNNAITGTWSPELNNTVTSSYTFTPTDGQCANSASTIITVNSIPAPTGPSTQTFVLGQTLNNIEVNGTGIVWYGTPSDAMNRTNVLPNSTVLLNETTYYATQTVGSCTSSDYLAVQVTPSLDVKWFKNSNMIVYPIPVSTILHIKHSNSVVFDKLVLSDVTGKVILIQTQNTDQINVERFAEGTYFIKAFSGEEYFISKFIKK